MRPPFGPRRVDKRNATFQHWQTLLTNRTKRTRSREVLIQGVRPITVAIESGVELTTVLLDGRPRLSRWAREIVSSTTVPVVAVASELMAELGDKDDGPPELLVVARMPEDDLDRLPDDPAAVVLVLDRPSSPGNIGTLVRSADALGAAGVITTGHAADVWDPRAVRASTGSVFALPVVRTDSAADVLTWVGNRRDTGHDVTVVGTDETGDTLLSQVPLTGGLVLVVGSEARGMSRSWVEACDVVARIPMVGSASSLNAAASGSIALYEVARRRTH
ncbi:TrmH family RNA methyltransferase [Aeromicrobium sp. CTD01-1L150]|uniref:TrmH family RNA methyltransferase n=1 Tax=Aeromicrobium sp. CTD01-1L150 TaxID=3341830 RepID=UPI0035BF06B3